MSRKNVHVTPREGGWAVKSAGSNRASSIERTQAAAIDVGRRQVKSAGGGSLYVHGRDNRIREERTYPRGSDPYPPKG